MTIDEKRLLDLIGEYFDLVYAEGAAGRDADTMAGDAQRVLSEITAAVQSQAAEIERCHKRLEIDRVYVGTEDDTFAEQLVPMHERPSMPDGIECRDSTISLLEADIERLTRERDELSHLMSEVDAGNRIVDQRAEAAQSALSEALEVVNTVRDLNMSGEDENGHRWANSDLIEQECHALLSKYGREGK